MLTEEERKELLDWMSSIKYDNFRITRSPLDQEVTFHANIRSILKWKESIDGNKIETLTNQELGNLLGWLFEIGLIDVTISHGVTGQEIVFHTTALQLLRWKKKNDEQSNPVNLTE